MMKASLMKNRTNIMNKNLHCDQTQTLGWFLLDVRFQKSYNLTPYLVFPAGTEIRRVIGLCIEWSGSASPAHISLEISTLLAPSNSPIDRLKIAQLHSFPYFFLCCSPRNAAQLLFLAPCFVNKIAQPYLTIPICMHFF